jgi:hypothetical protein
MLNVLFLVPDQPTDARKYQNFRFYFINIARGQHWKFRQKIAFRGPPVSYHNALDEVILEKAIMSL